MKGHVKTDNKFKKIFRYVNMVLLGCDDDISDGYTEYDDIPEPTIQNFPEESEFIFKAARIEKQFEEKAVQKRNKISHTRNNKIETNEAINKRAKERRNHIKKTDSNYEMSL